LLPIEGAKVFEGEMIGLDGGVPGFDDPAVAVGRWSGSMDDLGAGKAEANGRAGSRDGLSLGHVILGVVLGGAVRSTPDKRALTDGRDCFPGAAPA
jgi:hypothetical protein